MGGLYENNLPRTSGRHDRKRRELNDRRFMTSELMAIRHQL